MTFGDIKIFLDKISLEISEFLNRLFLTFSGEIAGVAGYRYIYINSYAWEGSSGSGVFDSNGNFIGYIVAVDIGKNDYGVQILNNLVLVIPSFHVNWGKTITEVKK